MEGRGGSQRRGARAVSTSVTCRLCDNPINNVCEHCSKSSTAVNNGGVKCRPRPYRQATVLNKHSEGNNPQGAAMDSGSAFRNMLREGNKILGKVTRNVASATDQFFGVEEEEDIDQIVEDFKKAQLEGKK